MTRLSELVKSNRTMHHETQAEYAARHGYKSAAAVSLWEDGKRSVPNKVIEVILGESLPSYRICPECNGRGVIKMNLLAAPASKTEGDRHE